MGPVNEIRPFNPPSFEHWLGTDALGNSFLRLLLESTWLTAVDVAVAASLALLIGLTIGGSAAVLGGNIGRFMFRVALTFSFATPLIAVLLLLYGIVGDSAFVFPLTCGFLLWGIAAITLQTAITTEWNSDYLLAARSFGVRPVQLVIGHLLPNLAVPLWATWIANWPIMLSASLLTAYLGGGLGAPRLGTLLKSGYDVFPSAWWLWLPPTGLTSAMFAILFAITGRTILRGAAGDG